MRCRVMAILLAVALGGTPVGSPIVGWVADRLGPLFAVVIGAAAIGLPHLVVCRHIRLAVRGGRPRLVLDDLRPAKT
jgi:MFS family permease